MSSTCNLAKACSHVFGSVMHGIAGRFTRCKQQQPHRLACPAMLTCNEMHPCALPTLLLLLSDW